MAGCDGMSFHNVSRSAWTAIKRAAASDGISGGDSGHASAEGHSVTWKYYEGAGTLHIQCLESPALIPCSEINARLQDEVGRVVAAANAQDDGTMIA